MKGQHLQAASALLVFISLGLLTAFTPPAPPECKTYARKVGADYYIQCPIVSNCAGTSLCDYASSGGGGSWKHRCACDDGSPSTECNGYMNSGDPDPSEPGNDVKCFETFVCPGDQICDEEQLTTTFQELCNCKNP